MTLLATIFSFILAVFGTTSIAQAYKKALMRYGRLHIQAVVGLLSLTGGAIIVMLGQNETFLQLMKVAGLIFTSSITVHQVLIKQFEGE